MLSKPDLKVLIQALGEIDTNIVNFAEVAGIDISDSKLIYPYFTITDLLLKNTLSPAQFDEFYDLIYTDYKNASELLNDDPEVDDLYNQLCEIAKRENEENA